MLRKRSEFGSKAVSTEGGEQLGSVVGKADHKKPAIYAKHSSVGGWLFLCLLIFSLTIIIPCLKCD